MAAVAQRSILGPDLWNVSCDSLLWIELPEESMLVGYDNDMAARDTELSQQKLNRVMHPVNVWMVDHSLTGTEQYRDHCPHKDKNLTTLPMCVGKNWRRQCRLLST